MAAFQNGVVSQITTDNGYFPEQSAPEPGLRAFAFAPLKFQPLADLDDLPDRRLVPARTILYAQNERPNLVYFIESGIIKLTRVAADGGEVILGLRGEGWIIDASSTFLDRPYSSSAVAVTGCRVKYMTRRKFLDLVENSPQLLKHVNHLICEEIKAEQEQQLQFRCSTAAGRLKRLLEELPQAVGGSDRLPLKQYEIAQLISITPEHLSRLLH